MILQALTQLYEDLADRGEIARQGWAPAKISYALCLDESGNLVQMVPMLVEEMAGKKTVLRPQKIELPAEVIRPGESIRPNFLWDHSGYILGVDGKGKPKRSQECFRAAGELHQIILGGTDHPVAKAILSFFENWSPDSAPQHDALTQCWDDLMKGGNILFQVDGQFPQDIPEIQSAWTRHCTKCDGPRMQCLVTGEMAVVESVHPRIKGVTGAQPSGAAIVSFDKAAFCSYGRKQSLNAPVSKYAAFAYTSALNHLLADRDNVHRIGETTVVCWAEGAEPAYQEYSATAFFGAPSPDGIDDDDLRATVKRLAAGLPCPEKNLDPSRAFYILGIAPNSARLSVRFFYRSTFGEVMRNINAHHERLEIVGSRYPMTPLLAMLRETVRTKKTTDETTDKSKNNTSKMGTGKRAETDETNDKSKEKMPSPVMAGATARAIFSGTAYPAALLEATMLRIRAERAITPGRAAIIKAYYLKNPNAQCPKEVLTVSLNKNSTNIAYNLGRLFSVYEAVQKEANPGIKATITDKYFSSASATPVVAFPILGRLCKKHLRKLDVNKRARYERQIAELMERMGEEYPIRFALPEQGSFDLGYYHQTQACDIKKEDK